MATTWADLGIAVGDKATGQLSVPCPRCSPFRKKKHMACLSVNLDEGLWMCHHCQFSGSLRRGEDQRSTPAKVYRQPEPLPEQALPQKVYEWFQKRGIPASVVRRRKIAYQKVYMPQLEEEAGVICFPYYRNGLLVNIKYRSAQKHFRMATGCELVLYGLDDVQEDSVVFCEGELDALALEVAGITSVLSVPNGAPAVTSQNYARHFGYLASAQDILVPLMRIVLACDNDPPGQKLAEELARRLGPERCWRAVWPQDCAQTHAPWKQDDGTERTDCKDANEVLLGHGQERLRQCIEEATSWPIAGIIRIVDLLPQIESMYEHGLQCGVSPGWLSLAAHYTVREGELSVITGLPAHGKALDIDTPIPTVDGWKTMGEIVVGDKVFDEKGSVCTVTFVTNIMYGHACYEMEFSDGTTVRCDADHEWITRSDKARVSDSRTRSPKRLAQISRGRTNGSDQSYKRTFPSAVRTQDIAESIFSPYAHSRLNHNVAVAEALSLPNVDLPIAPYTLGAWLGDGDSRDDGFTKYPRDAAVIDFIRDDGYTVTARIGPGRWRIEKLKPCLRDLDLLNNKHIPPLYLRASIAQRADLLCGLMDTDGYVTPYGRCEFTSIRRQLAEGVYELVATMGWKPVMLTEVAKLYGRVVSDKFRVTFTPNTSVFRLPRKAQFFRSHVSPRLRWRSIVRCAPIPSVPVRCIQVDSPSHLYLCTKAFVPTHNTRFLSNILVNLARHEGWRFACFSPESTPQRYTKLLLEQYTGKPFDDRPGRMSLPEMWDAMEWLNEHFCILAPGGEDPTVEHMLTIAKTQVLRMGIQGVVIDPWSWLAKAVPKGQLLTHYIAEQLISIKFFCSAYHMHFFLLAHPTKLKKETRGDYSGKIGPPTLYDISDSAHFFNFADNGLCVWRDTESGTLNTEVHIQKIRFEEVGKTGMVILRYDPVSKTYHELPMSENRYGVV